MEGRAFLSFRISGRAAFLAAALVSTLLAEGVLVGAGADALEPKRAKLLTAVLLHDFPHCYYTGAMLSGESLSSSKTRTAIECQYKCREVEGCSVFHFYEGNCTLHSLDQHSSVVEKKGAVIGPRVCRESCKEEGIADGELIRLIRDGNMTTLDECARECESSQVCAHASYDYVSDMCYLLGGKRGDNRLEPGTATIAKRCEDRDHDVAVDQALDGSDIGDSALTETWKECRELAQTTEGCTMWSWSEVDKTCKLKSDRITLKDWKEGVGWVSGPTWPWKNCFRESFRMVEGDLISVVATSAEHCQLQCVRNKKCRMFSYKGKNMKCRLLVGDSWPTFEAADGWTTGPVVCSPRDWCVEWGRRYMGEKPIEGGVSYKVDAVECRRSCREREDCLSWSFDRVNFKCVHGTLESASSRSKVPHYVTGLPRCGEYGPCGEEGAFFGDSKHLRDVKDAQGPAVCQDACYIEPNCYHYAFFDDTCRLYPKNVSRETRGGAVGGPAVC